MTEQQKTMIAYLRTSHRRCPGTVQKRIAKLLDEPSLKHLQLLDIEMEYTRCGGKPLGGKP